MPMPPKKSRNRALFLAVALFAVAAVLVFRAHRKTEADYYVLKPIDLNYTILANCTVDYPKPLDMSFQSAGIVLSVEVKDGEPVSHGQALVRTDDFEARRNVAIGADRRELLGKVCLKEFQDPTGGMASHRHLTWNRASEWLQEVEKIRQGLSRHSPSDSSAFSGRSGERLTGPRPAWSQSHGSSH